MAGRASENAMASAALLDPKSKKARRILADPSGYLANAKPAALMVRQTSEENILLHRRFKN
jgi:hypothetical protein